MSEYTALERLQMAGEEVADTIETEAKRYGLLPEHVGQEGLQVLWNRLFEEPIKRIDSPGRLKMVVEGIYPDV